MSNEIITKKDESIDFFAQTLDISPEVVEAQNAFRNKKIPAYAIQERPARGGQVLQYVDHVYATESIQNGLLPTWSFELLDYEYFDDHSVLAICKFTYHIPYRTNGGINWIPRTVTEAGNFTNDLKLPKAPAIAAATSRGLVRCMMRLFGFGIEFYKTQGDISPDQAWSTITTYAKNNGLLPDEVVESMKSLGIGKETIVDRFNELFEHIGSKIKRIKIEPMPDLEPVLETVLEPEPEPEEDEPGINWDEVEFDTWKTIDQWLQFNGVDVSDAIIKVKDEFGQFNIGECPKYQQFLAKEYNLL